MNVEHADYVGPARDECPPHDWETLDAIPGADGNPEFWVKCRICDKWEDDLPRDERSYGQGTGKP